MTSSASFQLFLATYRPDIPSDTFFAIDPVGDGTNSQSIPGTTEASLDLQWTVRAQRLVSPNNDRRCLLDWLGHRGPGHVLPRRLGEHARPAQPHLRFGSAAQVSLRVIHERGACDFCSSRVSLSVLRGGHHFLGGSGAGALRAPQPGSDSH